jgi:hypothetical protein
LGAPISRVLYKKVFEKNGCAVSIFDASAADKPYEQLMSLVIPSFPDMLFYIKDYGLNPELLQEIKEKDMGSAVVHRSGNSRMTNPFLKKYFGIVKIIPCHGHIIGSNKLGIPVTWDSSLAVAKLFSCDFLWKAIKA